MEDKWRNVPGYEGKYQINISTPEGRCRNMNFQGSGKTRELSSKPKEGYLYWLLSKDGKKVTQQAAVWIALTYPELVQNEYFPGAEIDHIDTDRLNNHPSNLRWVSHLENCNNPLTLKHFSEGQKGRKHSEESKKKRSKAMTNHPSKSKWVIKLSKNNEILHFYPSTAQAARETGVGRSHIGECCLGKVKSAGGFIWKYAE